MDLDATTGKQRDVCGVSKEDHSESGYCGPETTTNVWATYNIAATLAGWVLVANATEAEEIAKVRVKTDKEDITQLLKLLIGGIEPAVRVTPQGVRELRGLVAQRRKMTRLATQAKNHLHAVSQRHHLKPPLSNTFAKTNNGWWMALPLGKLEKMNRQNDLEALQFASGRKRVYRKR